MIAALLTTLALAQLPDGIHSARVIVEPPVAPFHKQVTLTIEVVSDPGADVTIPPMDPKNLGGLNIYGAPKQLDEMIGDDRRRVAAIYTLDPIHPSDYLIAPAVVKAGETEIKIPVPGIRIRDLTPEEEAAMLQMAPNAPPAEVPPFSLLPWILGAAGLTAAAIAAAYWYLRARPARVAGPPPKAPWEVAYARLRRLDSASLPAAGKYGRYYVELSNVLRHYVEDRYHLHAPERTTPEFLTEASKSGLLTPDQQAQLESLLKLSDRVKFAQYVSSVEEAEQSMADILQFIDESVPKEADEAEEAAA